MSRMEDLIRKIRALRAKAEGTTNEHEAAAFAAKVQQLLSENNISEASIKIDEEVEDVDRVWFGKTKWDAAPQRKALAWAVARLYYCEAVAPRKNGGDWSIVGKPTNVIVAREMIDYLINTTIRLSKNYNGPGNKIHFRRGCFVRLTERVKELRKQQAAQAQPTYGLKGQATNVPALYKQELTLVKDWMRSTGGFKFSKANIKNPSGEAFEAGREAGDKVSLATQVGGGRLAIGSR